MKYLLLQSFAVVLLMASCTKKEIAKQPAPVAKFTYSASGKFTYKVNFSVIAPSAGSKYGWNF